MKDNRNNGRENLKVFPKEKGRVAEWKPKLVEEIASLIDKYPTVAVIDMQNLPSKQLQRIRAKIKDKALIRMTRKKLIKRAIEACKKSSAKELIGYIKGMPAVMFSEVSAFELFDTLKQNMSDAPAKPGQQAPFDIIVPAGPTPFAPGPIISELSAAKIKASVREGKVVVVSDSIVARQGEKISDKAATILTRLRIHPMKIGINICVVLENDEIYTREILDIDKEQYIKDLVSAYQNAYKLALSVGILTAETVIPQLQRAHSEAKRLALVQNILADEVKEQVLAKAGSHAEKLKESLPEVKEEIKAEEKIEEPKKEEIEEKALKEEPEIEEKKVEEVKEKESKSPESKEELEEGKTQEVK